MKKKLSILVVFFLFGIIIAIFIAFNAFNEAYRNKKIEKMKDDLEREAIQIEKENDIISKKIEYYKTAEFQEKIAKEKLNMQKEGESVIIVKPSTEKEEEIDNYKEEEILVEIKNEPNYIKWWNLFFKY